MRDEGVFETAEGLGYMTDVMPWYGELANEVLAEIYLLIEEEGLLGGRQFDASSRAKTPETLREKLIRQPTYKLPSVVDIAGVRIEAEMSLGEQLALAHAIARTFNAGEQAVEDIRKSPHSGYRAVHVRLKFPSGSVEVQIRTPLQGLWANVYEEAGDCFGRDIRYGVIPEPGTAAHETVDELHRLSKAIADLETLREIQVDVDAVAERLRAAVVSISAPQSVRIWEWVTSPPLKLLSHLSHARMSSSERKLRAILEGIYQSLTDQTREG